MKTEGSASSLFFGVDPGWPPPQATEWVMVAVQAPAVTRAGPVTVSAGFQAAVLVRLRPIVTVAAWRQGCRGVHVVHLW